MLSPKFHYPKSRGKKYLGQEQPPQCSALGWRRVQGLKGAYRSSDAARRGGGGGGIHRRTGSRPGSGQAGDVIVHRHNGVQTSPVLTPPLGMESVERVALLI